MTDYQRQLVASAPEVGERFQDIADDYERLILPGALHLLKYTQHLHYPHEIGITLWQHPSFFAYFPTANTFESIIADLYSSSISNPGFNVRPTPALFFRVTYTYFSGPRVQPAPSWRSLLWTGLQSFWAYLIYFSILRGSAVAVFRELRSVYTNLPADLSRCR
jgi:hypothetical protein